MFSGVGSATKCCDLNPVTSITNLDDSSIWLRFLFMPVEIKKISVLWIHHYLNHVSSSGMWAVCDIVQQSG